MNVFLLEIELYMQMLGMMTTDHWESCSTRDIFQLFAQIKTDGEDILEKEQEKYTINLFID